VFAEVVAYTGSYRQAILSLIAFFSDWDGAIAIDRHAKGRSRRGKSFT
jgi:hypothetical protein